MYSDRTRFLYSLNEGDLVAADRVEDMMNQSRVAVEKKDLDLNGQPFFELAAIRLEALERQDQDFIQCRASYRSR